MAPFEAAGIGWPALPAFASKSIQGRPSLATLSETQTGSVFLDPQVERALNEVALPSTELSNMLPGGGWRRSGGVEGRACGNMVADGYDS